MKRCLGLLAFSIVLGVMLTVAPFVLPLPLRALEFFHWPLLLADRHVNSWIPLNAGKRVITLFSINVCTWTIALVLLVFPFGMMGRKRTS